VARAGRNFAPDFLPELTPKEMLALGAFCGKYMTDSRAEFPASWFQRALLSPSGRDCSLNYFGVDAIMRSEGLCGVAGLEPSIPVGFAVLARRIIARLRGGRRLAQGEAAWFGQRPDELVLAVVALDRVRVDRGAIRQLALQ
jgi:hypothetical protein